MAIDLNALAREMTAWRRDLHAHRIRRKLFVSEFQLLEQRRFRRIHNLPQ
jgi:hypothetical protein